VRSAPGAIVLVRLSPARYQLAEGVWTRLFRDETDVGDEESRAREVVRSNERLPGLVSTTPVPSVGPSFRAVGRAFRKWIGKADRYESTDRSMPVEPAEDRTILLTGPVTLYEVSTIRETLRTAMAEGTAFRIDLSDSGPWDVAGLQLLISCVKGGRQRNQGVRVVNVPPSCAELAERSGLSGWLQSVGD
jgi:ABC-type transporter Mla MlaB component